MLISLILISASILLASCNGTGGATDSDGDGETYSPGSSSSGSGAGGSSAGGITGGSNGGELDAWDIMSMMDSGHAEDVVNILTDSEPVQEERTDGPGRFSLALPADSFGIPEDGFAFLEILGGDDPYRGIAPVSPDGMIHFDDVPKVPVGAEITVIFIGYAADETTVICSGTSTGTATSKGLPLSIPVLGRPPITFSNGTVNGNTASIGGVDYEVVEYTGSSLSMTAVNTDSNATMEVTVNGSTVPASTTLSDGCNTIVATVTRAGNSTPVATTRNVYAVKALSEDDVSVTPSGYSTSSLDGDYELLRYSYLSNSNDFRPDLSVGNEYTGDAGTSELGASYLEIKVSGETTVEQTPSLLNQRMELGECIVTVKLCKPLCTPVTVTKKYRIKIKPIKVTISNVHLEYDNTQGNARPSHYMTFMAGNADGYDTGSKYLFDLDGLGDDAIVVGSGGINPELMNDSAWLTGPGSSFEIWSGDPYCWLARKTMPSYDKEWTLDQLKASNPVEVNSLKTASNGTKTRYMFKLTLSDSTSP